MKPLNLLLIEDSEGDGKLLLHFFESLQFRGDIVWLTDGATAIRFLKQSSESEKAPKPDVILLDLNLPSRDGRDVLKEVQSDLHIRDIPVIVFTSSERQEDRSFCQELGARCYLTKPSDLNGYSLLMERLVNAEFPRVAPVSAAR